MSIFTETFPKFIVDQLNDRQSILQLGDTLSSSRTKQTSRYPAGAFYTNTIERQCILRMSSGVDLNEEGEKNILKKGTFEENDWKTENLAKNWVLEGGIPYLTSQTYEGEELISETFGPRGGFNAHTDPQGNKYKNMLTSYGDPLTRSDASNDDGFGTVPMPGIIDANIKVKSAYGSLREAKVNFVCHNRRQLEVLELLYMRPGYTILLEWGWNPYIKKIKGQKLRVKSNDFFSIPEFWDKSTTFEQLNILVQNKRLSSGGNYDGMVGYVKNFEIKAREDGGYDCSTTVISMGEILEALKGKRNFPPLKMGEDDETKVYDNFEVYLMACLQYMKASTKVEEEEKEAGWSKWWSGMMGNSTTYYAQQAADPFQHDVSSVFGDAFAKLQAVLDIYAVGTEMEDNRDETVKNKITWQEYLAVTPIYQWLKAKKVKPTEMKNKNTIDNFLIHKGEPIGLHGGNDSDDQGSESKNHYIRWDMLVEILNNFVIEDNDDSKKLVELSYVNDTHESSTDSGVYLEYSTFQSKPPVMIPIQTSVGGGEVDLSSLMDISVNPKFLLPHQISTVLNKHKTHKLLVMGKGKFANNGFDAMGNKMSTITATDRAIGLIYIDIEYLLESYRNERYSGEGDNEKFSLINFIKKIWEDDITGACAGTHNFILQCPNGVARIIDVQYQGGLKPEDLYSLDIQSKNSIVRDFNFNTTIDKKLSSTIAIAAQAPKSISSLDQLSFAAFNKNITNRFVEFKDSQEESRKARKKLELDVCKLAYELWLYKKSIFDTAASGDSEDKKGSNISVNNAVNKLLSLQSKVLELGMTYPLIMNKEDTNIPLEEGTFVKGMDHPKAGMRRPDVTISKSTIIPLKFSAKLDGLGGVVIGNVFKVKKDKLPAGYQGDDIAFTVFGLSHKIDNGQDWTTEIQGQMILLNHSDLGKEQTSTSIYSEQDLFEHSMGGTYGPLQDYPTRMVPGRGMVRFRRPYASRIVEFFDNEYPDGSWGGNGLDGWLTEKVGDNGELMLDSGGDMDPTFTKVVRQLMIRMKHKTKGNSLINDPYHVVITGGNDLFHHNLTDSNSRHKTGRAIDITIKPDGPGHVQLWWNLLNKFVAANNGRLRILNEYTDPTEDATGGHFHISWNWEGKGTEGLAEYEAAKLKYVGLSSKWSGDGPEASCTNCDTTKNGFYFKDLDKQIRSNDITSMVDAPILQIGDEGYIADFINPNPQGIVDLNQYDL